MTLDTNTTLSIVFFIGMPLGFLFYMVCISDKHNREIMRIDKEIIELLEIRVRLLEEHIELLKEEK